MTDSDVRETEHELVSTAQQAVSRCNWVVGECAAKWTKRYARGRTDADFGALVGMSGDQIFQRRRVWETFGDVCDDYASLKWSHFYAALNWDDAPECLQWAEENQATVAEMKAWRRALRGEEAEESPPEEWPADGTVAYVPDAPTPVRDPEAYREGGRSGGTSERERPPRDADETVAGVARESDPGDGPAAAFGPGDAAAGERGGTAVADRAEVSAEQFFTRVTGTLERLHKALTPELAAQFARLPQKTRSRFFKALDALVERAEELR